MGLFGTARQEPMGQEEVLEVLERYKALCLREIAEHIDDMALRNILRSLTNMVNREVIARKATKEEYERIKKKYPTMKHAPTRVVIYEVK